MNPHASPSPPERDRRSNARRRVRWNSLVVGVWVWALAVAVGLAWAWIPEVSQRQARVLRTAFVLAPAFALLWIGAVTWWTLLSGLPRRWRWSGGLVGLALAAAAAGSIRIDGVTGDVVPTVEWRWSRRAGDLPATIPSGAVPGVLAPRSVPGDWPGFLGPTSDGVVPGLRLADDLGAAREIWRRPVGAGWSGFAVSGPYAVTHEQRGDAETVTCYALRTGQPVWSHAESGRWHDPLGGPGPRATPAIADGRVYALGATGTLVALELATGRKLWDRDVTGGSAGAIPEYGVSASPLVTGECVVVGSGAGRGRSLTCFDRVTGDVRWEGGDDPAGYGSPARIQAAGMPQIVWLNAAALASHDPETGRVLWRVPWPGTQNTTQPVAFAGDRVFASSGYGFGGRLFALERGPGGDPLPRELWRSLALKSKFANVLYRDGHLYGLDDGILTVVDVDTGERRWKRGRYGHGQILGVDDRILVMSEKGFVALVAASPDGFTELDRIEALDGKTWNHPAVAGRTLLVRNDREAACFELPVRSPAGP